MAITFTLKNIPEAVYDRLKQPADAHRRSLNSETIVCMKSVLLPAAVGVEGRLARARQLRSALAPRKFRARDIDAINPTSRQPRQMPTTFHRGIP